MKELITLIDSNHHLLHNYIFLSMYWNMIRAYSPGIIPSPLTSIMSRNLLLYVMSYFLL